MTTYVIMGMHRSGSSLVANVLHENGIPMGDESNFVPKPNNENERGFYENFDFRRINDRILENALYRVKDWKTVVPHLTIDTILRDDITPLLAQYRELDSWGFKCPRTTLTWRIWQKFLNRNNTKVIYVYRNPLAVANSLLKRKDVDNLEHGLALWKVYNEKGLPVQHYFDTTFVNYDTFLEDGKIGDMNLLSDGIIDMTLKHNEDLDIPNSCKALWERLEK